MSIHSNQIKIPLLLLLLIISILSYSQERLVKVKGNNFNVFLKGFENRKSNSPVVIFENGLGMGLGNWDIVIEQIAKITPVLAYDRAGVEKSDKIYQLPTVKFVAENLKAILTTLKIPPPYVLVGHSMGGVYVRGFAGFYPNEVVGLVFIDPADFTETKADWNSLLKSVQVPEKRVDEMLYDRLYQAPSPIDSSYYGPWSEIQVLTALRRTDFAELNGLPLPQVPIYFFIGGRFEIPLDKRSKDYDHEDFFIKRTNINIERWKKFIYSSNKGGSLIYLSKSGHYLHREDTKSVIANIKVLLESLGN